MQCDGGGVGGAVQMADEPAVGLGAGETGNLRG